MKKNYKVKKRLFIGTLLFFLLILFPLIAHDYVISPSYYQMVPQAAYQKALDISLKIWTDLEALQRGNIPRAQTDWDSLLDLTVGRIIYLKKCLTYCLPEKKNHSLSQDLIYLKNIIEYIMEDAQQLLLYDTDRAFSIEQLLKEVEIQLTPKESLF